jgi:hypothetical protein
LKSQININNNWKNIQQQTNQEQQQITTEETISIQQQQPINIQQQQQTTISIQQQQQETTTEETINIQQQTFSKQLPGIPEWRVFSLLLAISIIDNIYKISDEI